MQQSAVMLTWCFLWRLYLQWRCGKRANLANTLVQVEFPKATLEQFYIIDRLHHTAVFFGSPTCLIDGQREENGSMYWIANPSSQYQKNRHAQYQDGYSRHLPPSIGQTSLCCTCFKDFDLPNFWGLKILQPAILELRSSHAKLYRNWG